MNNSITCKIEIASEEIFMVNPCIQMKAVIGEHTAIKVKGIIHQESHAKLIGTNTLSDIKICYGADNKILFWGLVTHIDIQVGKAEDKEFRELYLEAKSFSFLMDRKPKYRSFQNTLTYYTDIVELILSDYKDSNYIVCEDGQELTTDRFIVQYKETDWEFLKRLASQINLPMVASHITYGSKFTMGVIWKTDEYKMPEDEEWKIERIHSISTWSASGFQREKRCLKWCTDILEEIKFEIGDCILYKDEKYYVQEFEIELSDYTFKHQYILSEKSGFFEMERENYYLTGLSLPATVEEVKGNQIRPHLDIDVMEDRDCWFTYATFYATFYCMPEVGDRIYMYFPNEDARSAYILNSVRTKTGDGSEGKETEGVSNSENAQENVDGETSNPSSKENKETIDIAPMIHALLDPENGTFFDATAGFTNQTSAAVPSVSSRSGASANIGRAMASPSTEDADNAASQDFSSLAFDPGTKVLSTPDGKRVVLSDSDGSISIAYDDETYIFIKGSEIIIKAAVDISLQADGDIVLDAKNKLILSSDTEVAIACKNSVVAINPDIIHMEGTDIKINN